jgi:hypothetical protein
MDPIIPIVPGLPSAATPPVERLPRISRDRDRPARERRSGPRREPPPAPGAEDDDPENEDGRPRVDVRV